MRYFNATRTLSLLLLSTALLSGCGSTEPDVDPVVKGGTFTGGDRRIGNGEARAFVTLDDDGNPTEIGVRIDQDALAGLPYNLLGERSRIYELELPAQADSTPFRHVTIDWYPQGDRGGELFDTARFDIHFFMMEGEELVAIDPVTPGAQSKAENLPPSDEIPSGYTTDDSVTFEPNVGVHWYDPADLPGPDDFEKILLYGSWDGALTFIETRLAWDWLVNKPEFSEPLARPVTWPTEGSWPTTWSVSFDEENRHFVVTLGGFD